MTRWVIDASVVVKWVLPDAIREPDTGIALEILDALHDGRIEALQPVHWLAEVAGVVTRIRPSIAEHAVRLLQAMALPVSDGPDVLPRACTLGAKLGHHVFDTLYHAVALADPRAILVTANTRYLSKARDEGRIRPLSGWSAG